jgi:hypothetical protein
MVGKGCPMKGQMRPQLLTDQSPAHGEKISISVQPERMQILMQTSRVALMLLLDLAVNEESSLAKDMLYSCLLNGCQTKAARGSGMGDGRILNRIGLTFDWVLSCTPTINIAVPVMESPKSGKKHFVLESTQPEDLSWKLKLELGWPSWSGWMNATNKFNCRIIQIYAAIDAWMAQNAEVGSLV